VIEPEAIVVEEPPSFASLGTNPEIVAALADLGIVNTFAIQALTLPIALGGTDLIGQARTGTGKTLGFGVPLLQRLDLPGEGTPQALVVVPTRELCVQVTEDLRKAGLRLGARLLAVYGGRSYEPQVAALQAGIDVVVGTPGRLLDLARQGHLKLGSIKTLVLDEADEMLDLGFLPDIERIVSQLPTRRQTMLFSATMPGPIVALARRFMERPVHIRAEQPDEGRTVPTTRQHIFRAHALDKIEMLARILQAEGRGLTMVFVRTKRTAAKVADDLASRGFASAAVHGDLGQGQREQALRAFRAGKVDVLVATDVAARGIDVQNVTHVVNYQCPEDEKVYLHRIGRTGRAGENGIAITFVDWDDLHRWGLVNTALSLPFADPPETYSTSQHFYELMNIPLTAKGTLPRAQRTRAGLEAEQLEDVGETGRKRKPEQRDKPVAQAAKTAPTTSRPPKERSRTRGAGAAKAAAGTDDANTPLTSEGRSEDSGSTEERTGTSDSARRRRRRGGRGRSKSGQPTGSTEATAGGSDSEIAATG
jgi:superfamily II DNA/RNA helicase